MNEFQHKNLYSYQFNNYRQDNKIWLPKRFKKKTFIILLLVFIFFVFVFWFWFTRNVLIGLPDITKVKDMIFSQATVIQDRNWKELYKLFQENREYVELSWISQNMINAIVAIEDQRYREHNWLDTMGLIRAWLKKLLNPGSRMQWASTIPQQLVRNLLLTKDRKIARKLKEIILTSRLGGVLEKQIIQQGWNLPADELRMEMKKKTLELYLDYISFGNNAFGVEAASKSYFTKSAIDLTILESSILASIPKWPSLYDPYRNRKLVMWEFKIKASDWRIVPFTWTIAQDIINKFKPILAQADLSNKKSENSSLRFLKGITSFSISSSWGVYDVEYVNGRKDQVLARMYEDWYIDEGQFKEAFLQWLNYVFRKNTFPIQAPHFVQWIIEELEKQYDTGTLFKWWFTIKTTLDLDIQKVAEETLAANSTVVQSNGANNSSMIYLDTKNWDVLAYVWSLDYFNEAIKWQNDMVRRPRQSWSAIKPFIYSLAFQKLPLTLDTPIFDIPFKIWTDQPNNADDKFEWMLPLRLALWHSRNIPSAKMVTALWWELIAKPFLKSLWLNWVSDNVEYGYTIALWAAEVTMLELANAYAHLSTDKPAVVNPILEIRARDGSLIYQKTWENYQKEVIQPWIRYLLWKILSDPNNRIPWWIWKFNVSWLTFGLKTWTSNVKTEKWNRPRDGRLAAYTPSKVVLYRAWNADATPMNRNAFGWTIHANPVKGFLWRLLKNNYIINENIKETEITKVRISKISGKLASDATPADLTVDTIKYSGWPWLSTDEGATSFQFDWSCNWLLSPYTPPEQTKIGYLIKPTTFMPNGMDLNEITQRRKESSSIVSASWVSLASGKVTYNFNNIFIQELKTMCPDRQAKEDTSIAVQINKPSDSSQIWRKFIVSYSVQAQKNIRRVAVLLDDVQVWSFNYSQWDTKSVTDTKEITLNWTWLKNGDRVLKIVAFDFAWFSNKTQIDVNLNLATIPAPSPSTGALNTGWN